MHLDISSALRTHPLELIASFAFMIPIVVVCGLSQVVLAVYETVEVFANMLTHANVRLPRAVERHARSAGDARPASAASFRVPAGHRFQLRQRILVLDRLFGTLRGEASASGAAFRFGLDDVDRERAGNFVRQLELPFRQ